MSSIERINVLETQVSELRNMLIRLQEVPPQLRTFEWLQGRAYETISRFSWGEVELYSFGGGPPAEHQILAERINGYNWWNGVDIPEGTNVYVVQRPWGYELLMNDGVAYGALDEDLLSGASASVDIYLNNSSTGEVETIHDRIFIPTGFKLPVGALVSYLRHHAEAAFILITSNTCPIAQ